MDKGLEKLNQSKPTECENCAGKMKYNGTGEYICQKCGTLMYDDYGKVRKFIDEHGASSILVLERETGVSKDVLEYLLKDGVLTEPPEASLTKICSRCGYPIESGRYCRSCMLEMANELAGAMTPAKSDKSKQNPSGNNVGARMHLSHRRRG